MYVTAQLTDGLGNRLFQIAAVLHYAKKHGHTPVFVEEFIRLQAHAQNKARIQDYFPELPTIHQDVCKWKEISEPPDGAFTFYELPYLATNVCLRGYFQAHSYTNSISSIPRLLSDSVLPLNPYESCAFLHVRRGDYLLPACRHHNVLLEAYWRYALAGLVCAETGTHVLVCSNDLGWCRKELPILYGDIVPCDRWIFFDGDEVHTLAAMIRCGRGGIVANSTFSWWGAAFNTRRSEVYMPVEWGFPPLPPVRDLYPPWATILPT